MESSLYRLGISLALGLLVGLQRERTGHRLAGIRTFALISTMGTLCGLMIPTMGPWIVAAGLLSIALLFLGGELAKLHTRQPETGLTTEVSALVLYCLGAYLAQGQIPVGVVLGTLVALLLYWKEPLHDFVTHISSGDIQAIMQFALISLVILPILPNQGFGPYKVLNPFEIWLMVVLIVGIGLAGYICYKLFGAGAGLLLGGILGGLVSSTATTVSYARRTRQVQDTAGMACLVILMATTVSLFRMLAEVALAAPSAMLKVALPLLAMAGWLVLITTGLYWLRPGKKVELPPLSNPAELKPAIIFAALFGLVLLSVATSKAHFGNAGLYPLAIISGLPDMDAITLSTARLMEHNQLAPEQGWRVILLAFLSNLMFKTVLVATLGSKQLLAQLLALVTLAAAGGAVLLYFWQPQWQLG